MDESWTLPSWRAARPLTEGDELFRELLVDLGPAMPRATVTRLSGGYLDALLRTRLPSWLRVRLQSELVRRGAAGWSARLAALRGRAKALMTHSR
ncbi:hypothetical protein OLX02_19300 [Novosphingobium sp. KCTC 2891]|uniref:hypothetical protein n=1 Tax=Novosphingobium sp. KCTC 2891 TaxID=2989730 RepID=UPI002221DB05|nr:hypothetical protein [Novosphingobium sp. KCTC 2891]MCW1384965.1 hypothetical protein [Novosphingobium sp. KCTC 2891]